MGLKLQVLGVNSSMPAHSRITSSFILSYETGKVLIDCGEGTQIRLNEFKIKRGKIDIILISHLHGDHFFGLPGLLSSYNQLGRSRPLFLIGPGALKSVLNKIFKHSEIVLNYPLEFISSEVQNIEKVFSNEFISISAFPMKHRIPTFGYLISEVEKERKIDKAAVVKYNFDIQTMLALKKGEDVLFQGELLQNSEVTVHPIPPSKFAYCSDTIFDEDLIPIVKNVDLLYHEATFLEDLKEKANLTKHSTAKQAATIAKKAEVGKLIIGHFSTRYEDLSDLLDEAKEIFPNTYLAEEGKEFEI